MPGLLTVEGETCTYDEDGEETCQTTYTVKPICSTCPPACRARSIKYKGADGGSDVALGPCLEEDWGKIRDPAAPSLSRGCQAACNNLECDYDGGDCSLYEITSKCRDEQEPLASTYAKPPTSANITVEASDLTPHAALLAANIESIYSYSSDGGSNATAATTTGVPVMLHVHMDRMSLTLDTETNEMKFGTTLVYRVQWSDPLLMQVPCRAALPYMLSVKSTADPLGRAQQISDMQMQWIPNVTLAGQTSSITKTSTFVVNESLPWLGTPPPSLAAMPLSCTNCAVYQGEEERTFSMSAVEFGPYYSFPFDEHELKITINIADGDIYNCADALRDPTLADVWEGTMFSRLQWEELLLPATQEWNIVQDMDDFGLKPNDDGSCSFTVIVRRNFIIFFVKQIVICMIMTGGGIAAMTIHPLDHTGDRVAQIMVAALILVLNYQADFGLGKVQYLIWYDYFNLAQLGVLFICLCETIYVHQLCMRQRDSYAVVVDNRMIVFVLGFFYPTLIIGLFCLATPYTKVGGILLLSVGLPGISITAAVLARWKKGHDKKLKREALLGLKFGSPEDEDVWVKLLRKAFNAYDIDSDGAIDFDQMRDLVTDLYPKTQPKLLSKALMAMREYFEVGNDQILFDSFVEALRGAADPEFINERPGLHVEEPKHLTLMTRRNPTQRKLVSRYGAESQETQEPNSLPAPGTGTNQVQPMSSLSA